MPRIGLAVVIALGCGGGAKTTAPPTKPAQPPPTEPAQPPVAVKPALPPITAEIFCKRGTELAQAKCGEFASAEIPATCVDEVQKALDMKDKTSCVVKTMGRCMMDHGSCEEVSGCIKAIDFEELHAPSELRACTDPADERPVGMQRPEYDKRNGVGVTKFSQARSTKDKPIEICGIGPGNKWLVSLSCNDGSKPLHNNAEAETSRVGNVGAGGRCGSIIDHYRVKCPENAYDIFTDGYVCPADC